MASSTTSVATSADFTALAHGIETMNLQIVELNKRLDKAMGLLAKATPAAPTASAASAAPEDKKTKGGKKAKKEPKEPKEKKEPKTCPPAAEGVVRFSSSAGKSPYRLFSPLYKASFTIEDKEFSTVEHYAQYAKFATSDPEYAESLLDKAPATLRMAGKTKAHTADEAYDVEAAYRTAYEAQIAQNEESKAALVTTGEAPLEAEYPSDAVLGIGEDGTGQNLLGTILMALRITLSA